MKRIKDLFKKGDTIIEVTFSIAVFSLVSVITIQIMDRDLSIIQGTLEYEMARNEIDAQAEALRFIQNSYLSERELATQSTGKNELTREYMNLWLQLSRSTTEVTYDGTNGLANLPTNISQYTSVECSKYYKENIGEIHKIFNDNAFVINTRKIDPNNISGTIIQSKVGTSEKTNLFVDAPLYPRIIYTKGTAGMTKTNDEEALIEAFPGGASNPVYTTQLDSVYDKVNRVEGIWVISARDYREKNESKVPEFYDFHIRTCWYAPGHDRPSTVATTIRLYNPEYVEDQR